MAQTPSLITHPSHPKHTLTLLSTPAYTGGTFYCNGCRLKGHDFCYHCSHCNFDLYVSCAFKPLSLTHQSHNHQLMLTFGFPYHPSGFTCNICRKPDNCNENGCNHWLYRCAACRFDAHLECVTDKPTPLTARPQPQPQIMHNRQAATTGGNSLTGRVAERFVEGAAKLAGQSFAEKIINYGDDDDDNDDVISSLIDIGSSILDFVLN